MQVLQTIKIFYFLEKFGVTFYHYCPCTMPIFLCAQLCKGCCKDARLYERNVFITTENFSQKSRNKMNNLK